MSKSVSHNFSLSLIVYAKCVQFLSIVPLNNREKEPHHDDALQSNRTHTHANNLLDISAHTKKQNFGSRISAILISERVNGTKSTF